jgi:hypothetical protein
LSTPVAIKLDLPILQLAVVARHAHLGDIGGATDVATALTGQHTALHQLAHHLLGEKRIPRGPVGDDRRQFADRGIRTQSEPPTSAGLACRHVGACRRHLMKQINST